ncbi:16890_t:CDS:2, partial [Racocetra persica]
LTHAIKRWIKIGHDIESGEEIQDAIKDLAGTHVANIIPNREEEAGYILARSLPWLGPWKKYAPEQIIKITKDHIFKKPEPMLSEHTIPPKSWTMPTPQIQNKNIMNKSTIECQENLT